ncbi:hypothetical protein Mesau_03131 [Mesorhizobium australicum WSM2073]|uniref:Uncharacterized protein n=1 Tax=Mesorhizobium australicum (strain HAMBI 3006 / LMG 24608 / WSM2073) TaxID=754035 RepID=L0KJJ7_MESAW|nr:hypothetical protein Mesau_03131 [Mesorhizobium australicum WSM2073]
MSRFEAPLDAARKWARPLVTTSSASSLTCDRRRLASLCIGQSPGGHRTPSERSFSHVHAV